MEKEGLHDDPLLLPEDKAEMLQEYNKAEKELLRYRRTHLAKEYPGLSRIYKELGYEFDEPEPIEAEPIPKKPKVDYAAFLDD